jgi:hypothetical protein
VGYPSGGCSGQIRRYVSAFVVLSGKVDANVDYWEDGAVATFDRTDGEFEGSGKSGISIE